MKVTGVFPAHPTASRFPGKLPRPLRGKPLAGAAIDGLDDAEIPASRPPLLAEMRR